MQKYASCRLGATTRSRGDMAPEAAIGILSALVPHTHPTRREAIRSGWLRFEEIGERVLAKFVLRCGGMEAEELRKAAALLSEEPAQRWGFGDGAPQGPALLPPLEGLLDAQGCDGGGGNVVVGVPPLPAAGNLGEGVSVRCVATRRIELGERLVA